MSCVCLSHYIIYTISAKLSASLRQDLILSFNVPPLGSVNHINFLATFSFSLSASILLRRLEMPCPDEDIL